MIASRSRMLGSVWLVVLVFSGGTGSAQSTPSNDLPVEFFEKKIRPLLADNCYNCHSANNNSQGGLRVDDRNGLLSGGGRGPAVVPGDPEKSWLIKAVRHTDDKLKMPPKKQLTEGQVADLTKWIQDGAVWPKVEFALPQGDPHPEYEKLRNEHWAWQPLRDTKTPAVRVADWARGDIDRFVQAKLDEKGLSPVRDADKWTLIRRVTFDLTGLPPTPEAIEAFVNDNTPTAFETAVDRLLASPGYGERWARHWLDVARYGESSGSSRNVPYPHAWRYRDYVIDAFTNDKPYDQFLREQIAGDLLLANSDAERDEHLIATGFLALGVKDVNQRFKVRFLMDNVDEQIDTVSRAVLGLTVSCARCHDHKFDPIPTTDYYALAGIFRSTDLCAGVRNKMGGGGLDYYDTSMLLKLGADQGPDPFLTQKLKEAKQTVDLARAELQALQESKEADELAADGRTKRVVAREKLTRAQAELSGLNDPALTGKTALGVRDSKEIRDTEIRVRGEAEALGPVVPRGFLSVLQFDGLPSVNPQQSGRLELAQWLTSDKNPLTSRVIVNRVWKHLFGQGLVVSVDNFGVTGDSPSHPELLDHLARRFVADGWSIKRLVRAIVLTRAYQLSSEAVSPNTMIDPANRLVWRHSPRRLDAEEIRDAMLAASGKLTLARAEASPAKDFKVIEMRNNGPEAQRLLDWARTSTHRSLYLPLLRGVTPTSLEAFDFAQQGYVVGSRDSTTVATQALYLLNDPFVRRQAVVLAERLLSNTDLDDAARIDLAYRLTLGRSATTAEVERIESYLADYETAARELLAPKLAEQKSKPAEVASNTPATTGTKNIAAAQVANPDQNVRADEATKDETLEPTEPKLAAWASLSQALLGTAEFRFVK